MYVLFQKIKDLITADEKVILCEEGEDDKAKWLCN